MRAGNAVRAYLQYISKTLWPADLAAFYPYSKHLSAAKVIVCGGLLVVLCGLFLLAAQRRPYLVTGWFWYLGTLVPTIGLVQVGSQAMADRYMYIPSIGLFVAVVWGLEDFLAGVPRKQELLAAAGSVALAGCLAFTWIQIQYWHDSLKLFRHAMDVTKAIMSPSMATAARWMQPAIRPRQWLITKKRWKSTRVIPKPSTTWGPPCSAGTGPPRPSPTSTPRWRAIQNQSRPT